MGKEQRAKFGTKLKTLIDPPNVYFQPPEDAKILYPAIVYERDEVLTQYADNLVYHGAVAYQVTLIANDPDHEAFDKLMSLPHSRFERHFATSGLNHDVFVIYH